MLDSSVEAAAGILQMVLPITWAPFFPVACSRRSRRSRLEVFLVCTKRRVNPGDPLKKRRKEELFLDGDADGVGAFLYGGLRRQESKLELEYDLGRKSPPSGSEVGARMQPPKLRSEVQRLRPLFRVLELHRHPAPQKGFQSNIHCTNSPRFLESKKTHLEQLRGVARRLRPVFHVLEVPVSSEAFSLSRLGLVRQQVEVELLGVVLRLLDLAAEVEQIVGLQQVIGPYSVGHVALQESTSGEGRSHTV